MGIFIDVDEGISEKIIEKIVELIREKSEAEDSTIRKICKQTVKYLIDRDVDYEVAEKNIDLLNRNSPEKNPFYTLLLGLQYEWLDEDEKAIEYFNSMIDSKLVENFYDEFRDFLILGKFYTLSDLEMLEQTGNILIDKYSDEETITDILWQLSTKVDLAKNIPTFLTFSEKALQKYPDAFRIEHFKGHLYSLDSHFEDTLKAYLFVADKLKESEENPNYNNDLAIEWNSIAICQFKLNQMEQSIESCDIALHFDENSEDFHIKPVILRLKAEALLSLEKKDQAQAVIEEILADNADDADAIELMEKIKNK